MSIAEDGRETREVATPAEGTLKVGDTIDFEGEGRGVITARDGSRVYLQSPVWTGWIEEAELLEQADPDEDEGELDDVVEF